MSFSQVIQANGMMIEGPSIPKIAGGRVGAGTVTMSYLSTPMSLETPQKGPVAMSFIRNENTNRVIGSMELESPQQTKVVAQSLLAPAPSMIPSPPSTMPRGWHGSPSPMRTGCK